MPYCHICDTTLLICCHQFKKAVGLETSTSCKAAARSRKAGNLTKRGLDLCSMPSPHGNALWPRGERLLASGICWNCWAGTALALRYAALRGPLSAGWAHSPSRRGWKDTTRENEPEALNMHKAPQIENK